jgi:ribonuclease P protein component
LVRRVEYDAVYRDGRRKSGREFAVFLRPNGLDVSRFGWSIKKAVATAKFLAATDDLLKLLPRANPPA